MKRRDILKKLRDCAKNRGLIMRIVEGANHTRIYIGTSQTVVGRHTEIEDRVARGIFSQVEGALGKGWWK